MTEATSIKALAQGAVAKTDALSHVSVTAVMDDPAVSADREVDRRWSELASQGHGPQRHGPHITEDKLEDRVLRGFDPVGQDTRDAFTGQVHRYGRHATRFTSQETLVKAEHYIRTDPEFEKTMASKKAAGQTWALVTLPIQDVLGPEFATKVDGKTRKGTKRDPGDCIDTVFTGGSVKAVYRDPGDGNWLLHAIYPYPPGKSETDDKGRVLPDPIRDVLRSCLNVEAAEALALLPYYLGGQTDEQTAATFAQQLRYVIEKDVVNPVQFEALTDEDFDTQEDLRHWLIEIERRLLAAQSDHEAHEASHDHGH